MCIVWFVVGNIKIFSLEVQYLQYKIAIDSLLNGNRATIEFSTGLNRTNCLHSSDRTKFN